MSSPQGDFPDLIPIARQLEPAPFPTDALPGWLRHFVTAQAEASQLPVDMIGLLSLSALSTAIQGRVNVVANEGRWVEPVTLYTASTMEPGERKSAALEYVYQPLLDWELEIQEAEWPVVAAEQRAYKELELAVEKADARVQKLRTSWMDARRDEGATPDQVRAAEGDLETARREAEEIRVEFESMKPRYKMRLVYNDLTPEAAAKHLSEQFGERISIISDEGGVFEVLSGSRYSDRLNLDVFLKGHSGNIVLVDRVGRESERINRPMITLGLAVQPVVLKEIGKSKQMHGRGLLARFLYSHPAPAVGSRSVRVAGVPSEIRDVYSQAMQSLAGSAYAQREIRSITLTDEAQEMLYQYQEQIEPRLKPEEGDLDPIRDWASKLSGALLRIAVLIACAREQTVATEVEGGDMMMALQFSDYLINHALRAYTLMGLIEISETENKIVRKIQNEALEEFTSRDMYRAISAHRTMNSKEFEDQLEILANQGYFKKVVDSIKPPKHHWVVNPAVHEDSDDE